jgi:predicted unusual protein kinase regulating ubiquinone biosynthesis (AarF/ABC1/UbiB family)
MYRFSFRIPPYYTLLVRSLSVLEGIALASDPNYKARRPWAASGRSNRPLTWLAQRGGSFEF